METSTSTSAGGAWRHTAANGWAHHVGVGPEVGVRPADVTAPQAVSPKIDEGPVRNGFDAAARLPTQEAAPWERRYLRALIAIDMVVAALAGAFGFVVRFQNPSQQTQLRYLGFTVLLPLLWLIVVAANRAYERRFLYVGSEEMRRVLRAGLMLVAGVSSTSYALQEPFSRGYMLGSLPLAVVGSVAGRHLLRNHLHRQRHQGECMNRTIIVGHPRPAAEMTKRLSHQRYHGLEVVAACLPPGVAAVSELQGTDIPVVARAGDIVGAVNAYKADVVVVLSCPEMDGEVLRRLSWHLERTGADLLVAPALVDVTGPRTSVRLASGLLLLHVEPPEFSGTRRVAKSTLDRLLASCGLVVTFPILLAIAIAIRLEGSGPVIFRQVRVGKHGEPFTLLKFRTMRVNADSEVERVRELNESAGLPFKVRSDPRITRAGKFLRGYSLDELPQLVNVIRGEMSLVGPRPLLPHEVSGELRRRLVVPPGMTGLWQVSGRSDLLWDQRMQIDLFYVENWSPALDLLILAKTARAVIRAHGAY